MITKEQIVDVMKFARMAMQTDQVAVARLEEVERLAIAGLAVQPRPIEEAPRDGSWFLALEETEFDVIGFSHWWAGTARFEYPNDGHPELMRASGYDAGPISPAHFIPLSALGKPGVE